MAVRHFRRPLVFSVGFGLGWWLFGFRDSHRRFAGILIDVFYDHFLALDWDRYAPLPLSVFTAGLYADIRAHPLPLPEEARAALERMLNDDRLGSYRTVAGIEAALRRVSQRLAARVGRPFELERAMPELQTSFEGLAADFAEFFPQLRAHADAVAERNNSGETS